MPKVTIIGAGSVEFTRNVLADLCSFTEMHGRMEIALHDIDPERLRIAEAVAGQVVERTGAGYAVHAHADRRPAFDGADYLVNEIQVGGYRATVTDFEIPKKYGLRQTIADTLGIGGIMRGLRTIPVMIEMGNEMAELCPHGILLNYTNPMAMVPWGVYEGSRFSNVVGLCHSVRDTHEFLAEMVGVSQEDVRYQTAGFNHQCFVYRFEHRRTREDLYPRLRERIDADPEGLGRRVRVEIFKRFGYFPTESSEHSSEYVPWVLPHDDQVDRFRILVDDYIFRSDENLAEIEAMKAAIDASEPVEVEPTSELASEVIHSMETGVAREIYGNVRNGGLIEGLPEDACVEVPCLVDKNGVLPTRIGTIPPQCLALNRTFVNVVELTVRAAIEQRRDLVYQAALVDPNTAATLTTTQIVEMVDDLIEAHGELIPEGIRRG
ncbi:MAG TPA: alpha-glucosidase/alpha-galactosidase [Actinomycetota bacterium]|jgi:alpha-galactosidase|nr:alpha-glucosidase/alpha-galactosidase [Actinomycetota bacterium]